MTAFGTRGPGVLLTLGAAISAVLLGLIPLDPHHGLGLAVVVLAIEGIFMSGQQIALYTLTSSVYSSAMRATGVGSASASGRLGAICGSFAGAAAIAVANGSFYFLYIAALFVICGVAVAVVGAHTPRRPKISPV